METNLEKRFHLINKFHNNGFGFINVDNEL